MERLVPAHDIAAWNACLSAFPALDPTFLPEYHLAYCLRIENSEPLLWHFQDGGNQLAYPFLLTPVMFDSLETGFFDISGIYGYTGPLATTSDPQFLRTAWRNFDDFARKLGIIAEFIRFSPFNHTERFAHPAALIEENRLLAISELPTDEAALLALLGSKTRNMLRKAGTAGLTSREMDVNDELASFRELYELTMQRNAAPEFFLYDDAYFTQLTRLGKNRLRLFGAFSGGELVAASMAVVNGSVALYHLGASLPEFARMGAGNLSLYCMSSSLMADGVNFINMTGGRTRQSDDPLLRFKMSNATGTVPFHIGKRILDSDAYERLKNKWLDKHGRTDDLDRIIFWRA